MLDTKLEENNGEKNNLRRTIDAIDGENNKVSYLANQKDNEEKLEFLKNFTENGTFFSWYILVHLDNCI